MRIWALEEKAPYFCLVLLHAVDRVVKLSLFFSDPISDPGVCVADYETKLYLDAVLRHWQSVALSEGWFVCEGDPCARSCGELSAGDELVFSCVFPGFIFMAKNACTKVFKNSLSRSWGVLLFNLSNLFHHSDCKLILNLILV